MFFKPLVMKKIQELENCKCYHEYTQEASQKEKIFLSSTAKRNFTATP